MNLPATMASTPRSTDNNVPVIWLAPPATLSPSTDPIAIHPLPLAISATLASLIILVLIVLYHKKPTIPTTPQRSIKLATPSDMIRVVRAEPTTPPPHGASDTIPDASPSTTNDIEAQRSGASNAAKTSVDTAATEDSSVISASQDSHTTPVQDYHSYLKDSIHAPSLRKAADTRSPPSLSNPAPLYDAVLETWKDGVKDVENKAPDAAVVRTAASSDYSVSIGTTPLISRQNSFHRGHGNGTWTRLRLGSEYDGDRTFVPSEANLRLGASNGNNRWV